MECFNHVGVAASATCEDCHKHICRECSHDMGDRILCTSCFGDLIAWQEKFAAKIKLRFIISGVLGAVVLFTFLKEVNRGNMSFIWALILAFWIGCIPIDHLVSGWSKSADIYVPTSLESAGKLMLINMAINFLFGPLSLISAFRRYKNLKDAIEHNKKNL